MNTIQKHILFFALITLNLSTTFCDWSEGFGEFGKRGGIPSATCTVKCLAEHPKLGWKGCEERCKS